VGTFGLSYVGIAYLVALWVPNIVWARQRPTWHDPSGENRMLAVFERVGQVLCTGAILVFDNTNPHAVEPWLGWFAASVALMILYLGFWARYFTGTRTQSDFYRPLLGIPAPGATLPVAAFLLLGVYGRLIWLIAASVILGVGHIGIHVGHAHHAGPSQPPRPPRTPRRPRRPCPRGSRRTK